MPGYYPKPPSPRLNKAHPFANGLLFVSPFHEQSGSAAYDLSGNGNNGTLIGGTSRANTPLGGGVAFDGVDGIIELGSFSPTFTALTFSAWINNPLVVSEASLIGTRVQVNDFFAILSVGRGELRMGGSSDGVNAFRNIAFGITANTWYHIVVTWNPTDDFVAYTNGAKVDTGASTITSRLWSDMRFGIRKQTTLTSPNDGIIDNVMIWDYALSGNEVAQLFHDSFAMLRFPNIFSIIPGGFPLTDNVYHAARHILTTYDKLPSDDINFNNLQAERGYWKVGRQVEERKRSNEYLRELARQSFVGIYPTRKGKRGFKAWREDRTVIATHDESEIEKILKFEKTPISKVYNDFTLNFDHNPGRGKFNKSLFIIKTDNPGSAGFPAELASTGADITFGLPALCTSVRLLLNTYGFAVFVSDPSSWATIGGSVSFDDGTGNRFLFGTIKAIDAGSKTVYFSIVNTFSMPIQTFTTGTFYSNGTAIQKWKTYVGGLNDYATGKAWWTICNESYDRTLTVNPLPRELGDCFWFPDNEDFGAGSGGSNNAAFYLLQHFVEWTTRQKYVTEYVLPINAANIQLELFDPIYFNDQKYTNNVNLIGWITKIKIVPNEKKPRMIVELILEPTDILTQTYIIETGDAADTITESGSQPDTITEGAQ